MHIRVSARASLVLRLLRLQLGVIGVECGPRVRAVANELCLASTRGPYLRQLPLRVDESKTYECGRRRS